jgi:hypothetical protein
MRRLITMLACAAAVVGLTVVIAPSASATTVSSRTLLGQLTVAAEHSTGYPRSLFTLWIDADHAACHTRYEVLIAEATTKPHVGSGYTLTGGKWYSQYDGVTTTDPSTFDINHLVPLAEAWQSGAWRWNADTRKRYANDLGYAADPDRGHRTQQPLQGRSGAADLAADPHLVRLPLHGLVGCGEVALASEDQRHREDVPHQPPGRLRLAVGGQTFQTGDRLHEHGRRRAGDRWREDRCDLLRLTRLDTGSTNSLNAEWVQLKNTTTSSKMLTGWTLRDASSHIYPFATLNLGAGATVKVHTGSGSDTASNLYWGSGSYITGDTATLKNANGTTVDGCAYSSTADPEAFC